MTPDENALLHRHLNGDLDPAEQAAFFERVRCSDVLRRALAEQACDEVLVSELVLEGRARRAAPRRSWAGPAAAAALMLIGLWLSLSHGTTPSRFLVRGEGVLIRDGLESPLEPGTGLRTGDRLRGHAVVQLSDARLDLRGEALVDDRSLHLDLGRLSAEGQVELATSRGVVRVAGAADLVAGRETFVEVRSGTARAGEVDIAAGRIGFLDGALRATRAVGHARVEEAVRRGATFLESRRRDLWTPSSDGMRHAPAPSRSYGELALLALRRAGYGSDHPVMAELLGRALTRPIESTYTAALQAMALAEIDPASHLDRLTECARLLSRAQARNGQWDYGVAASPPNGDNSVSAYAAHGLRACAIAGVAVDRAVLDRARRWWISCQNADGGWGYRDAVNAPAPEEPDRNTGDGSYGTMTAGAVGALAALADLLGPDRAADLAARRGLDWLAGHFAADHNPSKASGFSQAHWYVAAARAGRLLRVETFGAHEWYPEIADVLLAAQRPDGAWTLEQGAFMGRERNEILDTCLAILFLTR